MPWVLGYSTKFLIIESTFKCMNLGHVESVTPIISVLTATITLGVLIYVYLEHRRKPLLYWSVSWVFFILMQVAFYTENKERIAIFYTLFSGMVMSGVIKYLKEHAGMFSLPEIIGIVPFLFALYAMLLTHLGLPYSFFSIEVPFVVLSGVLLVLAGIVFVKISRRHRDSFYLGIVVIAFGIFTILYPVRMSFARFHYMWKLLATIVSLFAAFFIIRLVRSREFLFFEEHVEMHVSLEPGVKIMTPREYERVKKDLQEYPVLAFVRDLRVPENWKVFHVSNTVQERAISPTNLAYMVQMVSDYLREAREQGVVGVVVIDCPEYLITYNSFETVVKLLATLVDRAVTNNGALLVVVDKEALEERQFAMLRRILGETASSKRSKIGRLKI